MSNYLNLKTIGMTILTILVLCLFLSKTIYAFNMPQITATIPFNGKLSKTETANGMADWSEKEAVSSEVAGKVEEVFVKEGETVDKGQELMRLSLNNDELTKIEELKTARAKLELEIETINLKIEKAQADLTALAAEQADEIKKAQDNYDRINSLYRAGAIAQVEWETAAYTLKSTINKYNKQVADLKNLMLTYDQDIKGRQLDLQNNDLQLARYQDILSANGSIKAETAGTVGGIAISKGDLVTANQSVMTIGIGEKFTITCSIPLENSFVASGDTCQLTNSTHSFEGIVDKIVADEKAKTVNITVRDGKITPNESFSITFSKEGEQTEKLVPNGAIQQDSSGYFLYKISRREGVLGDEYYTERLPIYIGDSDNTNTVILNDIGFFEPVVLSGNKPFSEGETIVLKNGGDFFAKD